jgi:DNA-3-methyladenine glycosylase II
LSVSSGDRCHINAAIDHLSNADPALASWIHVLPTCDLVTRKDLFSCLCEAIISQLVSSAAAKTLIGRVRKAIGGSFNPILLVDLPVTLLRECGLSGSKAKCLVESARQVSTGMIDLENLARSSESEIADALTAIHGIGPWTAEIVMIFGMGKRDVLPINDLGVRHGLAKLYSLKDVPLPRECVYLTESWRPYRSIGTWYLWRIKDSAK